jgi:hypothetical protein
LTLDLRVAKASQCHQQQHVPVTRGQRGQRGGQHRPGGGRADPVSQPVLLGLPARLRLGPSQDPEVTGLLPPVRAAYGRSPANNAELLQLMRDRLRPGLP